MVNINAMNFDNGIYHSKISTDSGIQNIRLVKIN